MLYIVLGLVLAALGLLVAALSTATTLWAWLSIVISLAGAGLLFYDWTRNRRAKAAPAAPASPDPVDSADSPDGYPDDYSDDYSDDEVVPDDEPDDVPPPVEAAPAADPVVDRADDEPAEEPTDAADLLVVAGLSDEVRVVDERPRYHLGRCTWLLGRPTLALPVSEARQLGFTPCAVCGPDAVLAQRHRDKKQR
ncbi:hypothetical protein ACFPM7_19325 [Actinokineospora guangxiensis]|uniref:Uncharacterized protein n=1 Tax=Actinokineospora guangxiensis TaxID=1490288 RepID=A0ABW0EP66_9PSEU